MRQSEFFARFRRQVARRRRDLLREAGARNFIFPMLGSVWFPTDREQALCEAFVVLFVAELETYLEAVLGSFLDSYKSFIISSMLAECRTTDSYVSSIVDKKNAWAKNNNANWKRIEDFFLFVGLKKERFPKNLWDTIENIVVHRGDIVHNSLGVRNIIDPRITIDYIYKSLKLLEIFDRDFVLWDRSIAAEIVRQKTLKLAFVPGLGSINTGPIT